MKTQTVSALLFTLVLVCGLLSNTQAVVPPPDGGYPNFTTAEGTNALRNLTTGAANTAVGWYSLFSDTTGSFNTAVGAATLVLNTGHENTAIGTAALLFNTASGNTGVGSRALLNNTTGGTLGNVQGVDLGPNVAVGQQALESNTAASANTAVGYQALHSFTTGPVGLEQIGLCTAVGFQALANATGTGALNNAFGYQALMNDTDGGGNTAIGFQALFTNSTGSANVASGNNALLHNDVGDFNAAVGVNALTSNTDGNNNTAIGGNALDTNMNGDRNTAVGDHAGTGVGGNDNTVLGFEAGNGIGLANNVICIGANVAGASLDNSCYIGNIFGSTASGGIGVFVNSSGKLGTSTSSRRFKEQIRPMDQTSKAIYALKPVAFRYKKDIDPAGMSQFGLVAEDVEKINPDLVVRDKEGKPYSVRYDQVNAMLLNEFLKEHRKGEEQDLAISQLKSALTQQQKKFESKLGQQEQQIAALMADLQRLAADIELNKAESQALAEN